MGESDLQPQQCPLLFSSVTWSDTHESRYGTQPPLPCFFQEGEVHAHAIKQAKKKVCGLATRKIPSLALYKAFPRGHELAEMLQFSRNGTLADIVGFLGTTPRGSFSEILIPKFAQEKKLPRWAHFTVMHVEISTSKNAALCNASVANMAVADFDGCIAAFMISLRLERLSAAKAVLADRTPQRDVNKTTYPQMAISVLHCFQLKAFSLGRAGLRAFRLLQGGSANRKGNPQAARIRIMGLGGLEGQLLCRRDAGFGASATDSTAPGKRWAAKLL
ncbi:hypothetical protein TARUN_9976 [Trichoderma arundinaceum]|uniref:Uncharacterized protein n=1 Tax=Trichoderma arundinaceum TaxID=490622 RepID=A0A395N8T3_TRIAR|nr:hypothetical protein TARUN_9976 [Trichoderma arundinaceum]